ncbi:MAG: methyltransferase domain-containing protein [Candidatus Bathyarchaeia archaeon]
MYRLGGVTLHAHEIKRHVAEHYGSRATAKSCCTTPRGGCLAPLADIAAAREGDIVVDIGSGPGFDVCAFSNSVGEKGRVIGLDLSKEMIEVATERAKQLRLRNAEFTLCDAEAIPLESGTVDLVVSNCAINLMPDKRKAIRELARLLKPSGRIVIADEVGFKPFEKRARDDLEKWCHCISGAITPEEYAEFMKAAGLIEVHAQPLRYRDQREVEGYGIYDAVISANKPGNG